MITKYPRDEILSRYKDLQTVIDFCKRQLQGSPEGRLKISHRRNNNYYYHVTDKERSGGDIIDEQLAKGLAQRSYWESVLKTAVQEEKILKKIIERYPDPLVEGLYEQLSQDRQDLVTPVFLTDEQYKSKWLAQEFEHKGFKDGMPFYTTIRGERVRSKSEQIIADRLTAKNIPYIYEKPLLVGNKIFHPDFSILRMSDRKELYLEHLGRLGDMGYATDAADRLNRYHRNGIVIGDKLFVLWETAEAPFDVRTLDVLIEEMFR